MVYLFASELPSQNKEDKLQNKENKKSAESRSNAYVDKEKQEGKLKRTEPKSLPKHCI